MSSALLEPRTVSSPWENVAESICRDSSDWHTGPVEEGLTGRVWRRRLSERGMLGAPMGSGGRRGNDGTPGLLVGVSVSGRSADRSLSPRLGVGMCRVFSPLQTDPCCGAGDAKNPGLRLRLRTQRVRG